MKFERLFKIAIQHAYYSNGISPDFDLMATPECAKLLQKYKLRLQQLPGVLEIYGPEGVSIADSSSFDFWMRLVSPDFLQFTNLNTQTVESALRGYAFFRFSNETLNKTDIILPPGRYEHTVYDHFKVTKPAKEDYFFLQGAAVPGLKRENFIIQGLFAAQKSTGYTEELRRIQLDTSSFEEGRDFWVGYHGIPPWPAGVLGLIQIFLNKSWASGKVFQINHFSPASAIWKYYLAGAADGYSITSDKNTFSYVLDPPDDEIAQQLSARYPNEKIGRFTATSELPYQEQVLNGIKLLKNGAVVLGNLPNPSPANKGIQIIRKQDNKYIFLTK